MADVARRLVYDSANRLRLQDVAALSERMQDAKDGATKQKRPSVAGRNRRSPGMHPRISSATSPHAFRSVRPVATDGATQYEAPP